jgi:SSS family solute:Na+ symporter
MTEVSMFSILSQASLFCVFIAFLIVWFLYKKEPKTLKEYALGSGKYSAPILMCTMIAMSFGGGSILGRSVYSYQNGAWFLTAALAAPMGDFILSSVIIPRLSKYYGCISVAEVIGRMYGLHARKLAGIFAFFLCIGVLSAQIRALYWVMEHFFEQNALIATAIGVCVITLYSNIGGIAAILKTELIHFIIFIVIIPLVAIYVIQMSGGITKIVSYFYESSSRPFLYGGNASTLISVTLLSLLPELVPDLTYRLLVGKDCKKNQAIPYGVSFIWLFNTIFVGCVVFIALSNFTSLEPRKVLFTVVQSFIPYEWVITLFAIALVSMIIAVSRSTINCGAILLVNDVATKKLSEKQKMKLLKLVPILSVLVASSFTYLFSNAWDLTFFFVGYYLSIVTLPLLGGLFTKEPRPESFWISGFMGFITLSSLRLAYPNLSHEIFLISFVASLCTYLALAFAFRKGEAQTSSFSFSKLCDDIVIRNSIQAGSLSGIILLYFLLTMGFREIYQEKNGTIIVLEGIMGFLGLLLFCVDKLSIKHKSVIILSIVWYCFAFSPAYIFLHQTASFFTINFIVSIVLLTGLCSWNVFLTFLLSGSYASIIAFGIFNHGFQKSIAQIIHLFLFLGYMALIAFITFRKREQATLEFVRNTLATERNLEQEKRDTAMYNKILRAINTSLDADYKYRNDLLNQDTTIEVPFKDLKVDILAYFQKTSIERKTKLTVVNSQHKVLNTGFPVGVFYKVIYSLIFNVFYCNDTEDIQIKFGCDKSGKIRKIEISHGQYRVNDRAKYLKSSYPKDILDWDVIKLLFEQFEIKMTEGIKTLKVIFPSEDTPIESNVISFNTLRAHVAQEPVS